MRDDAEMLTLATQMVVSALLSETPYDKRVKKLSKIQQRAEAMRAKAREPEPKVVPITAARMGTAPAAVAEQKRLHLALADVLLEACKAELSAERSMQTLFSGADE